MTLIEQIAREYAAAYGEVKAAKINRAEERALHKCTEDLDHNQAEPLGRSDRGP